ncbi:MAG TPA: response regulator [Thermodesulfobacteriota bacterium]|nr:response regulator [Thermodesulfobacteriota bacterium]
MAERILIVDDEVDMLLLLKMILTEKTPYEIVTTPNPLEVEPLFKEKAFQLIITDLSMPGMNGIELIEVIKKLDPLVPVIIITAYGSIESAIDATRKGAFDFITKPFRKEQIFLTIEKALEFRKIQTENIQLKKDGSGGAWLGNETVGLTYDQAKERALAQFNRLYAEKLVERHEGDLTKAAREAGWSEDELKRFLEG